MSACKHCGDHTDHSGSAVGQAHCTYRTATTEAVRADAVTLGVDPVPAADLLAHLRGRLTDAAAYSTVLFVLDLGWRPTVGVKS